MDMEKKRLFLGIRPNHEWIATIEEFIRKQPQLPYAWVSAEKLHVTILFIGSFPVRHLEILRQSLSDIYRNYTGGWINFEEFAYMPVRRPRMVWAKCRPDPEFDRMVKVTFNNLRELYKSLDLEFEVSSHSKNIPHITLCRFKGGNSPIPFNIIGQATFPKPFYYDKVILFESKLGKGGATYEAIDEYNLIADTLSKE